MRQITCGGMIVGFEPKSDNHAIVEVVFGVAFARQFSTREVEAFANTHAEWKADLPRVNRSQTVEFVVGGVPLPPQVPVPASTGVMFDRVKPDGNIAWRLAVENQNINVHCLEYDRWNEIWPKVSAYIEKASLSFAQNNHIVGVLLQYIDVFDWRGPSEGYDLGTLLNSDSALVPSDLMKRGDLWHLHQGWFTKDGLPSPGRLLERLHMDGVQDQTTTPLVKIDSYMQLQMSQRMPVDQFFGEGELGPTIFNSLHDRNKTLVKSVLAPEMADRIGLS